MSTPRSVILLQLAELHIEDPSPIQRALDAQLTDMVPLDPATRGALSRLAAGQLQLGALDMGRAADNPDHTPELACLSHLWAAQAFRLVGNPRRSSDHLGAAIETAKAWGDVPGRLAELTAMSLCVPARARARLPALARTLANDGCHRSASRAIAIMAETEAPKARRRRWVDAAVRDPSWSLPIVKIARDLVAVGRHDDALRVLAAAQADDPDLALECALIESLPDDLDPELRRAFVRLRNHPLWGRAGFETRELEALTSSSVDGLRFAALLGCLANDALDMAMALAESLRESPLAAIREQVERLAQHIDPEPERDDAMLGGRLEHLPFASVLDLVAQTRNTGRLSVEMRSTQITIWLRDGMLVDAKRSDAQAPTDPRSRVILAVQTLLTWKSGTFRLLPWSTPAPDRSVTHAIRPEHALLEAARRLDETPKGQSS